MLLRIGACAGTMTTIGGVMGVVVWAAAAPADKMIKTGTRRRCIDALVNASSQYKPKQKPFRKPTCADAALAHRYARFVTLQFILRKTRRAMVNATFNLHCNAALSAAPVKRVWDTGDVGVQRKVFRVEQMFAERRAHAPVRAFRREPIEQIKTLSELGSRSVSGDELKRKLAVVQATIARNRQELAALIGASKERRMARAAGELGAAVAGMENATQKVLHQVEGIDECAKALTATLKDDYNRGLAQDIQDHTVQIYEACNFQDIAGQRIAKVIETLNLIEEQVSAMLARCDGGPTEPVAKTAGDGLINGPKLDGDTGHTSQQDIDTMFG